MTFFVGKCAGCQKVQHGGLTTVPYLGSYCEKCLPILEAPLVLDCAVGSVCLKELAESMSREIDGRIAKLRRYARIAVQRK